MPETQCCCYAAQQGSLKKQHTTQQKPECSLPPTGCFRNPRRLGANSVYSDLFGESAWVQAEKMVLSESYFHFLTQAGLSVECCFLVFFPLHKATTLLAPDFNKYPQLPKHCKDISFKEDLNPRQER